MNIFSEIDLAVKAALPVEKRIEAIIGNYQFVSPYHKSKKMLPFTIHGKSSRTDKYNVLCSTVYYRGWERREQTSAYCLDSLERDIETGFLIRTN